MTIPDSLAGMDDLGLLVVAGSHAYGLATPDSDVDYRGFFQSPLRAILGVYPPKDSRVSTDPDVSLHEVRRFVKLALDANPTVLEVLAIPDPVVSSPLANDLRDNFDAFLSDQVKARFGGYARSQFKRLKNRQDGSFSADTRKRTEKHARHLYRLLLQGRQLMETGVLQVRVDNPDRVFEFGRLPYDEMIEAAEHELDLFDAAPSILPPKPDTERINQILVDHRLASLKAAP